MKAKSQREFTVLVALSIIMILGTIFSFPSVEAVSTDSSIQSKNTTGSLPAPTPPQVSGSPNNENKPKALTPAQQLQQEKIENFNLQQDTITNSQSRLGDELKSLPGPNIDFQGLLRLIIAWSASLAASVAIFLVVIRSFASISGTEETHNELKSTIIKVLIGLVLIFFSYWIVSTIMGIIWAGGSVG